MWPVPARAWGRIKGRDVNGQVDVSAEDPTPTRQRYVPDVESAARGGVEPGSAHAKALVKL